MAVQVRCCGEEVLSAVELVEEIEECAVSWVARETQPTQRLQKGPLGTISSEVKHSTCSTFTPP